MMCYLVQPRDQEFVKGYEFLSFAKNISKIIGKNISKNELMSKKHKKVCTTLNYIEHFLIFASTITGCVSIFIFASLVGIPIEFCNWIKNLCNNSRS